MESEIIKKFGRLVYAKLFDPSDLGFTDFRDKNGKYQVTKLFWRFYWIE